MRRFTVSGSLCAFVLIGLTSACFEYAGAQPILFTPQDPVAVPIPQDIVVADLDDDGFDDLVVAIGPSAFAGILYGSASGQLAAPTFLASSLVPTDVAVGDLDADGALDIVLGDGTGQVEIFFGGGPVPYANPEVLASSSPFRHFEVVDVNGDGTQDLLGANESEIVAFYQISGPVPGPTLGPVATFPLAAEIDPRIVIGDVTGSGLPDVAARTASPGMSVANGSELRVNSGISGFLNGFTLQGPVRGQTLADFNQDGRDDLVESLSGDILRVFEGIGSGILPQLASFPDLPDGVDLDELTAGDFNGDGNTDLIALTSGAATSNTIGIMRGFGDLTFGDVGLLNLGFQPTALLSADVNGDERDDLIAWETGGLVQVFIQFEVNNPFRRGDTNLDGTVNISDVSPLLSYLFTSGNPLTCPDGADIDDNGSLAVTDAILLLDYLFGAGSTVPVSPGPTNCAPDPTLDDLGLCLGACP